MSDYDDDRAAQFERLVEATAPPENSERCTCDRCEDARQHTRSVA